MYMYLDGCMKSEGYSESFKKLYCYAPIDKTSTAAIYMCEYGFNGKALQLADQEELDYISALPFWNCAR